VRVVVLGATGNIGYSAVKALSGDQHVTEFVGLARRLPDWSPARTRFVAADVSRDDLTPQLRGADVAVLLAWSFHPTRDPVSTWNVNVLGTIRALEAAAEAGVGAVVYVSSVGAYSPGPGRIVDETWPTHSLPTAAYGREKSYLERYLDAYELRHPRIRVVRLRPSFVFQRASGSEQRRIFAGPLLPTPLLRRGRLPVVPVPSGLKFQAVHSDDVGEALRLLATRDARGAYNVAGDPIIDAAALGDVLGAKPVEVRHAPVVMALGVASWLRLVPADDGLLRLFLSLPTLDTSRIREDLGWSPRMTGVAALREALDGMADGAGAPTAPLQPGRAGMPEMPARGAAAARAATKE
jgi:nucleoside-diphosphate-sugar epimerase